MLSTQCRSILLGFCLIVGPWKVQAQFTEVPSTAPMEGVLLEMDLVAVASDHGTTGNHGVKTTAVSVSSLLVSKGLTEYLDIQFGFEMWHQESVKIQGITKTMSGQGDGWLRMKWNFSGDESESAAWAILPYLKLPLADDDLGNDHFEPGVALAYGQPLSDHVAINATLGYDVLEDGSGGHDQVIYASSAMTVNLSERLALYGELGYAVDLAITQDWTAEAGVGMVYAFNDRGWIDIAFYAGLTEASPDYTPVLRSGWQF